jgi:nucleoside-diphosphate-sugar epimerase
MRNKLLIFGWGYVAKALSQNLKDYEIIATSRNISSDNLTKIIPFDYTQIKREINTVTHIISTVPPNATSRDPVLDAFTDLIHNAPYLKYICYLSATSVYGNHNGEWVDENSLLQIETERAQIRYQAELDWTNLGKNLNIPTIIIRIAGIYGPGRNVFDKIKNGSIQYIFKEGQVFSRIHIDDIATALTLSLEKDKNSNIYNLSDDLPAAQSEVIEYAAKLLNIKLPESINFENANLSPMMREFYMSSKKISNKKVKSQLDLKLKYHSYKEGLKSLV